MRYFRVCPVDPSAKAGRPFHPSFVPRSCGQHRIDNQALYDTLYVSGSGAAAVAERFGMFTNWGDWLLDHPKGFTARLVTFELPDHHPVLDLDDAKVLGERNLRPSRVVTRDRDTTQAWAAAMHDEGSWAGISWWSYYNPDWKSCGLWCPVDRQSIPGLAVIDVEAITADHPSVVEASQSMLRPWAAVS